MAIGGLLLFVGMLLAIPQVLDRVRVLPLEKPQKKVLRRSLAEDIRIGRQGLYGVDVIRCGKCRLEKKRKGPLTFGGFNVLVLEDLRVVLPGDSDRKTQEGDVARPDVEKSSPKKMLAAIGLSDSFLKTQGVVPRFSGVQLEGLEVCRLEGTNVVTIFMAAHGKAIPEGLKLQECRVRTSSGFEFVADALLQAKPRLRLSWSGGLMDL